MKIFFFGWKFSLLHGPLEANLSKFIKAAQPIMVVTDIIRIYFFSLGKKRPKLKISLFDKIF